GRRERDRPRRLHRAGRVRCGEGRGEDAARRVALSTVPRSRGDAEFLSHVKPRRARRFSREGQGEGGGEGEEGCSGFLALRRLRGVIRNSPEETTFNHEHGSGRGTLGLTKNAARPGNRLRALRVSV